MKFLSALAIMTSTLAADPPAGRYTVQVREMASELVLHPGGTFDYALIYGAADYQAKGKWRQDGQFVILTTAGLDEKPFRITRTAKNSGPGITIRIVAPNGRGVPNLDVVAGDDQERTDSSGVAAFPDAKLPAEVRIQIPVYQLDAGPYPVQPGASDVTLEINGPAITRVPFRDERLAWSGDTLTLKYWNPDQPLRYRLVR